MLRRVRAERDTAQARKGKILDALLQIVGDGPMDRYRQTLLRNDPNGDYLDDWTALVRRVLRLCCAAMDTNDVAAAELRMLIAAGAGKAGGK